MADPASETPIARQCGPIGLPRSTYYAPEPEDRPRFSEGDGPAMAAIDRIRLEHPCYGARRMSKEPRRGGGIDMKRRRVAALMEAIGVRATYPKPNASAPGKRHPKSPYLLKGKVVRFPNQAWSTGIAYAPVGKTRMCLSTVIGWFSRHIAGWRLHGTLEASECAGCMRDAFDGHGLPAICNPGQGSTYSAREYAALLAGRGVAQGMGGKGRWAGNVLCGRAFRSIKQECAYINDYSTPNDLRALIGNYIDDYNDKRLHSSLDYEAPAEWYFPGIGSKQLPEAA